MIAVLAWPACGPPAPAAAGPAPAALALRPVGLVLGVTFEDGVVDDAVAARWARLLRAASAVLWQASEGQLYVARCTLEDRASSGHVHVPRGALEREHLAAGVAFELAAPGGERWRIVAAGRPADDQRGAVQLAAQIARGVFGLDAHDTAHDMAGGGAGCLMAGTAARLCADGDVPRLARRACRSVVNERWRGLARFPNPDWDGDEPPPTAFERLRETP